MDVAEENGLHIDINGFSCWKSPCTESRRKGIAVTDNQLANGHALAIRNDLPATGLQL